MDVRPGNINRVDVELAGVDERELASFISIDCFMEVFSLKDILDKISIRDIIEYHGQDTIYNEMDIDPDFQSLR